MMRHPSPGLAAFVLALPLAAQQPALAPEHAVLKQLAGSWAVVSAPASANAPAEQIETSELVCGGRWLETTTVMGTNEMLWLTGFDPDAKQFVRVRVSGRVRPVLETGEWDAKARKISWRATEGAAVRTSMTTVVHLPEDGPPDEHLLRVAADGKAYDFGQRTFQRAKPDQVARCKPAPDKAPAPELELLAQLAGDWECAITATMPGMEKPMRMTGRKREEVLGGGCWLRSSFTSEFGTDKIEGRGLMGYDDKQKRYVRFWVDSGSNTLAITSYAFADTGKKLVGTGSMQYAGGEVTLTEEMELGADQRHVTQSMKAADGKDLGTFEMVMTRRPALKAK